MNKPIPKAPEPLKFEPIKLREPELEFESIKLPEPLDFDMFKIFEPSDELRAQIKALLKLPVCNSRNLEKALERSSR